ncbi:MAG TPA: DUF1653 domain-containing protein [Candidatus Paceibacterota bacterium]
MIIPRNGFYVHYKHDPEGPVNNYIYEVVGIARNTEEKTFAVLYRPVYQNSWLPPADFQSRPLDMFNEEVEIDGTIMPRFRLVTDQTKIDELTEARDKMY